MTTKANGLLYADYARAMKAGKKFGAKKVTVEPDGAISFSFDELVAADEAEPKAAAPKPTPKSQVRANPAWEEWSNDPERTKLRLEWRNIIQRMYDMRREPPQPNGRMTPFAQLRETSPEFRRLEEERDKLDRRIGPEPPMFLTDAKKPKLGW